jgi:DNA-binding LacI/PurR family transcriptional regulator
MTGAGRHRPTLEAVAELAGVSRATASRVLRGESNVSPHAHDSVLAAARKLSYTPNQAARSLVTGRSESIAFLVEETEDRLFSDPFFLGMLRSAHARAAEAGYQLVFTVASSTAEHRRFLQYAAGGHVDGVLVVSLHGRDHLAANLENVGVPTVLSGRPLSDGADLWYVDADNVGGARAMTAHLLAAGRRAVATLTGPMDMCAGQDRLLGYRQAFDRAGRPVREDLVVPGEFTIGSGFDAMSALLSEHPEVDAVFAASDQMALGAIRAIEQAGRRAGTDVLVAGFDDIPEAAHSRPALTTVRQPIPDLGATMVERLLRRIEGDTPQRATVLPVELVVRETA